MAELTHTRHERDGANGAGKSPDPAHDVATQPQAAQLMFDNTYARELEGFYVRWMPAASPAPRLLKVNPDLALELGLDLAELNSPPAWIFWPEMSCPGRRASGASLRGAPVWRFLPAAG